jgi:hypothetical protein
MGIQAYARKTGMSESMVRRLCRTKLLAAYKDGRVWMIASHSPRLSGSRGPKSGRRRPV